LGTKYENHRFIDILIPTVRNEGAEWRLLGNFSR